MKFRELFEASGMVLVADKLKAKIKDPDFIVFYR